MEIKGTESSQQITALIDSNDKTTIGVLSADEFSEALGGDNKIIDTSAEQTNLENAHAILSSSEQELREEVGDQRLFVDTLAISDTSIDRATGRSPRFEPDQSTTTSYGEIMDTLRTGTREEIVELLSSRDSNTGTLNAADLNFVFGGPDAKINTSFERDLVDVAQNRLSQLAKDPEAKLESLESDLNTTQRSAESAESLIIPGAEKS